MFPFQNCTFPDLPFPILVQICPNHDCNCLFFIFQMCALSDSSFPDILLYFPDFPAQFFCLLFFLSRIISFWLFLVISFIFQIFPVQNWHVQDVSFSELSCNRCFFFRIIIFQFFLDRIVQIMVSVKKLAFSRLFVFRNCPVSEFTFSELSFSDCSFFELLFPGYSFTYLCFQIRPFQQCPFF